MGEDVADQGSGDLRRVALYRVVGRLCARKATGALEIVDAVGTSRAFVLSGVLQGGRSARLKNPLGRILVKAGAITDAQLERALEVHNRTDKLIGQVILELGIIDGQTLDRAIADQSRQNLLSLFGLTEGRFEFAEGLVHLADFTAAPLAASHALYEGLRDHAPEGVLWPLLSGLAFAAVQLRDGELLRDLGAAEQMALRLLSEPRLLGDLARRVPLPPRALSALLGAADGLGVLEVLPAIKARLT